MLIRIKTHPSSKKEKIQSLGNNKFEIWVKEKAEANLANKRVIEMVAEFYGVRENKIKITTGHHRPNKTLEILN